MPAEHHKRAILSSARSWYGRFERPISSISLIGGFVFDALTLRRVDLFWDNVWVVGHLTIVTVCAIWINLLSDVVNESGARPEADPNKLRFWLVNVMQFFFGGILSTFLVFYFRSGTLATSWPFLLILIAAFIANESLKRHYARLVFQISLLFLAFYAFAIYLVPIFMHEIGTRIFLISGGVSLAAILIVIIILVLFSRARFAERNGWLVLFSIAIIFAAINGLYFSHLIPPLPLSLMDASIDQNLIANGPGQYTMTYEAPTGSGFWYNVQDFFNGNQIVHIVPGDPLFFYTAVFSPTALDVQIVHEWQYYDPTQKAWVTRGLIDLPVTGGRDNGWRTYSEESTISAGAWRVNVLTSAGDVLGQLNFTVVTQDAEPALVTGEVN
jgi:hypothetical protein